MSEHGTTPEVVFEGSFTKPLVTRFDQPRSSSDAGAWAAAPDGAGCEERLACRAPGWPTSSR